MNQENTTTETPKEKAPRVKTDWASLPFPFKPESSQGQCFAEIQANNGKMTLKDFTAHFTKVVTDKGIQTKNVAALISTTLTDAKNRGWVVNTKHGDAKTLFVEKAAASA